VKRILLTGKNGQVGWELQRALSVLGEVIAFDSKALNLAEPSAIRSLVQASRPHIIVNAAAYTAVDKAESEPEVVDAVNGKGPEILAEEARRSGATLVHFSTDYVFDGKSSTPYLETSPTAPLSAYGKSKLHGEQAIIDSQCKHLIFRTSWVYANRGKNFMLTMLNLARSKPLLSIVNDQRGAPTWARSIAEGAAQVLSRTLNSHQEESWGIYNLTCSDQTTWFGFASAIFELYRNLDPNFTIPELKAITTKEYPTPAQRPLYSVLDNRKVQNAFHVNLPHWKRALELCLQERFTS